RGRQPQKFALVSLSDGSSKTFDGSFQAASSDGSKLAFIGREGADYVLNSIKLGGDPTPAAVKKSAEAIQSAAFSPDGTRLAFEASYTRNNEIFLIGADGKSEVRLTREIQHDRAPLFLSPTKVLAIKGESRHSRSYLYDTETLTATRLFHNNTIRTIAPEYAWVPDPAGTKLLIVSERDGDTMSPERGVYLLDLAKKVSLDALRTRLHDQLAAESALRAKGESISRPLASEVRAVVSRVSTTKIYGYEEALFDFDSKHVTQPGNNKASEYIFRALESFGYAPEYQWVPNRPNKTANVVVTLKGTDNPDLFYVTSAHYDSNTRCPGADDNSSSTAVLLETARLLAGRPLPSSVILAAFTGEEAGFWGSREFVRLVKERKIRVLAGLNNDMIGWTNDNRLDDTIRYTNAGIRDVLHAAAFGFSRLITYDSRYIKSTDSVPLYEAWGNVIGGLGSYPLLGNPYYHQPTDLLETVNHQLLTECAKFNTAAIMLLASSPSPVRDLKVLKAGPAEVELAWTPNPEKGITHYLVSCGPKDGPAAVTKKVKEPRVRLAGLKRKTGEPWRAVVKAVNARGLESWDDATIEIR
ncbi:MAG: M28 family peptidase, partial [Candidatus Aminicenantes bacterium]|nr:M28 family peptidase [Candidatus Aminicenantes bacterium]